MEAIGSNGFPASTVPPIGTTAVLDVKPLRTLSPMAPHPFMSMPGYAPGNLPYMCYNPYGPYSPGAPPGFPAPIPPAAHPSPAAAATASPEPITPVAPVHDVIDVVEPSSSSRRTQASSRRQPSKAAVSARGSTSAKRKAHEDGTSLSLGGKSEVSGRKASPKEVEIDTPSPPGFETEKQPSNHSGSIKSSSRKAEISTPAPAVSETKTRKGPGHVSSSPSSTPGGTAETSRKRKKKSVGRPKNKNKEELPLDVSSNLSEQESAQRILMIFDAVKRRVSQTHEASSMGGSANNRPDMKAFSTLTSKGLRANTEKRIGNVPGVNVGDMFHFRIEMCMVGLHTPPIAGIDYMVAKFGEVEDPVAISIVSSGGYEGNVDDGDVLIYSGQGGGGTKDGKQEDQKLERGNLALDRSLHHGVEIRVTRGVKDPGSPVGKVYIYDGLYKIQESWIDKGKGGFGVFKYKLIRLPGQPPLGSLIWKEAQSWKQNPSSRKDVIIADLSVGMEKTPVCLVNEVDDEKVPPNFFYISRVKYEKAISLMKPISGCKCQNGCLPSDMGCNCTKLNSGEFPYVGNGTLVSQKPVVYECSPNCSCGPNCRNRVTQNGVKFLFEVFKTKDKGCGLRSWDPIRAGSFICEYIGDVISRNKIDEDNYDDEYVFDAARERDNMLEWDGMYELLGEPRPAKQNQDFEQLPTVIDAKRSGNISRFMNHSCSPNVLWQSVLYDHSDESSPHIMFFARKNIPPMTELTYDYGISKFQPGKEGRRKKCLCGSSNCKGYFG